MSRPSRGKGKAAENQICATEPIEVAPFITDIQDFEARARETLRRNGIWRTGLKDESLFADKLIPANSPEYLRLMRRKHQN